ncbi:MAG: LCP family protein [Butyrivibrio sp.]|nr:LCP family protein [Butyrivibrio sp.]
MLKEVKRKKRTRALYKIPIGFRVLTLVMLVVLVIFISLAAAFRIMRTKGKKSLYNGLQNSAPVLPGFVERVTDGSFESGPFGSKETYGSGEASENGADSTVDIAENGENAASLLKPVNMDASQNGGVQNGNSQQGAGGQSYVPKEGDVSYNGHIYRYNSDVLTFLLMGIDSTETVPSGGGQINYLKGGQSDMMFLAVMNPHSKELSLIAINRNTMTDIDMYRSDGSFLRTAKAQICVQHGYGDGRELSCERAVQTVSEMLYELPIHGYFSVRLGGIIEVNDSVGGVTLTTQKDYEPLGFKAGETVTLDGDQAYSFLRKRDTAVFDSATDRLNRQKLYLSGLLKSVKEKMSSNISFPVTLYRDLNPYMVTNISADEVAYLASEINGYSIGKAKIYSLPGETVMGRVFEEFYLDEKGVTELILKIFYEAVN